MSLSVEHDCCSLEAKVIGGQVMLSLLRLLGFPAEPNGSLRILFVLLSLSLILALCEDPMLSVRHRLSPSQKVKAA